MLHKNIISEEKRREEKRREEKRREEKRREGFPCLCSSLISRGRMKL